MCHHTLSTYSINLLNDIMAMNLLNQQHLAVCFYATLHQIYCVGLNTNMVYDKPSNTHTHTQDKQGPRTDTLIDICILTSLPVYTTTTHPAGIVLNNLLKQNFNFTDTSTMSFQKLLKSHISTD